MGLDQIPISGVVEEVTPAQRSYTKTYNIHRKLVRVPAGWVPEPERKVAGPMTLKEAAVEVYRLHDQFMRHFEQPEGAKCPYEFFAVPAI